MTWIAQNLWLIPALPLAAAGLIAVAKQPQRRFAATLTIGTMGFSLLLSLCAFSAYAACNRRMRRGRRSVQIQLAPDGRPMAATRLGAGSALRSHAGDGDFRRPVDFIYSVGYMAHDENFMRFFCFLSLFAAAMLGLVIANSLLLFFICWELVGLTSYLLIGFWYHKPSAAAAAKKAFITTRIGDL